MPVTVYSAGVQASGIVGELLLWELIDDAQTPNWALVNDTQSTSWAQVVDGNTPTWVGIQT